MYAKRPPAFDTAEIMAPFGDIEELHQRERVVRALLRRVRSKLKGAGEYDGSKLAQLDHYHVKLSEISPLAITLLPMEEGAVPVQGRREKRNGRKSLKVRENEDADWRPCISHCLCCSSTLEHPSSCLQFHMQCTAIHQQCGASKL